MADPAPLRITCPACGVTASAPARLAGKTVRCSRCGQSFTVAAPTAAPAATVAEVSLPSAPVPAAPPARPAPAVPAPTRLEEAPAVPQPTMPEGPASPPGVAAPTKEDRTRVAAPSPTRAEAAPPADAGWQTGAVVLGLYEVTGLLGQGGMGRVYKVRHRGWGVDLAVKVPLARALEAAGGAEAFEQEAETWVNLPLHPHIVSCYYVRRLEGLPRVFAEFVDGGSLADAIRADRLRSLEAILDVAIQFAWGLHDAHEQGLVHKDVKPGNVMLTADGVVKVTDFGLASARVRSVAMAAGASGDTTAMAPGGGGGTPAYMSPEQWGGRPLSRRTDLWSWALAVLEMFLGQRTWEMGPAAPGVLEEAGPGGPLAAAVAIPEAVHALLGRCFAVDAEARPRTMAEAADALAAVYEAELHRAYPRPRPRAGRQTAAALNNRAVSLLDLGRGDAEGLWTQALAAEPQHLESSYNQALHAWTHGRLSDTDVLARVEEAQRAGGGGARGLHLLGGLLLAAGDFKRAVTTLRSAAEAEAPSADLQRDRGLALCAQATIAGDAGAMKEAATCLEEALRGGDEQPVEVPALARARIALGQGDEGRRFYAEHAPRHAELPSELPEAIGRYVPGHERRSALKDLTESAVAVAVTPDGSRVLAATGGSALRVWSTGRGHAEQSFTVPDLRIKCLAVTPDGAAVLVGGEGAPPHLCDLATGRVIRALQRHPGITNAVAIGATGRLAVAGSSDRAVRVWDLATGRCLQTFEGHTEGVACVALGDDDALAASGGLDGTVRLWDLATGQARATLTGHRGRVAAVALSTKGGIVLSGGEDRTLRQSTAPEGQLLRALTGPTLPITAVALSADGLSCAAASMDRTVRTWDLGRGRLRSLVRLDAPISSAAAAAGSSVLWASCGTSLHAVRLDSVWRRPPYSLARPVSVSDVQHRSAAFHQRVTEARESLTRGDLMQALKLAREARTVPGHERSVEALTLWDDVTSLLPRKGLESAWELAALEGHRDPVLALAVSGDGTRALSGDLGGQVRAWDLAARGPSTPLDGHEATVSAVALTPDLAWGVSASWDRTLRLWPLREGTRGPRVLTGHADYVNGAAVSPDGRLLLSASSDQTLRLWELPSGRLVHVLEGHESQVSACVFGVDGRYALSAAWDASVRVWDLETHSVVAVLEGHEGSVGTVAVSPDGRQAASGGLDGVVRLWDLRSRREARALTGHTAEVTSVAFFLDGRHLASSSRDKSVRMWDLASGRCVTTLPHTGAVLALAAMPAGNALVTAGTDLALRLWRLDWEPEARALPKWDEKVRTHLATLVTRRASSVATGAAAAKATSKMDVDTIVQDLRHRGFGGVARETVAARVDELAANPETVTSAWDEIRSAAPSAARRLAAAEAARRVRRQLPSKQVVITAAALIFALVFGIAVLRPKKVVLGLSQHQAKRAQPDLALVKFYQSDCSDEGGYQHYLDLAHERVVGEESLACLQKLQQPGLVDAYLNGAQLDDPDTVVLARQRRLAVSFLAGLGEPAVGSMCQALRTGGESVKWVTARALAMQDAPDAAACLSENTQHADPAVRVAALAGLRLLIARGRMKAQAAWSLVKPVTEDPDARVRSEAIRAVAMFSWEFASATLAAMEKDADPQVAAQAHGTLVGLRNFKNLSPDLPY